MLTEAQNILAKKLSETERTPTIVAYTALTMSVHTIIPALQGWQTPSLVQLRWIGVMAFFGTFAKWPWCRPTSWAILSRSSP